MQTQTDSPHAHKETICQTGRHGKLKKHYKWHCYESGNNTHLAVTTVGAIAAPQLWEVLLAPFPELATTSIEVFALLISTSI